MLIVITQEANNENEFEVLESLFNNGLEVLHVRKPTLGKDELRSWLRGLDEKNHHKVMLHQHHDLTSEFDVKGVHLTEKSRKSLKNVQKHIKNKQKEGKMVSTGFHSILEAKDKNYGYDYIFLSPVFNSISKKGYKGNQLDVSHIYQLVIALGGINALNIERAHSLGYKGVAVLGSVWSEKNTLEAYKEINQKYNEVY